MSKLALAEEGEAGNTTAAMQLSRFKGAERNPVKYMVSVKG